MQFADTTSLMLKTVIAQFPSDSAIQQGIVECPQPLAKLQMIEDYLLRVPYSLQVVFAIACTFPNHHSIGKDFSKSEKLSRSYKMSFAHLFDIRNIKDSYIFVWSDFTPLLEEFKITLREFKQLIIDLELGKNISAKKHAYFDGRLTLESGLALPFDPKTLVFDDFEVIDFYQDGSNTIVEIEGFPLSEDQRLVLEQMQSIRLWVNLPNDVFFDLIIKQQGIKGKDLISLCLANPKLNAKCNHVRPGGETIFTRLLQQDFGLKIHLLEARQKYLEQYKGSIWTFGKGDYGQLGHGDQANRVRPMQILMKNGNPFSNVRSVSCGSAHTAMILADGTIWTFGRGGQGRLGHGDQANQYWPKQIMGFNNVRGVSCGTEHTAMILADGTIWTFGRGANGRLGHGDEENQVRPKQIVDENGKPFSNVRSVSCGGGHTGMILTDGTIWTFGEGIEGQLGHGDRANHSRPKQIVDENGLPFSNVKSVSCGTLHTAMILADGTIWTFGLGTSGQLGHGDEANQERPKQIVGFNNVRSVSCGGFHTAMILVRGTIWTFGWNSHSQLGHIEDRKRPKQIKGIPNVRDVSCGKNHTAMILVDGTIRTLGHGGEGQLGHDDQESRYRPLQIEGFSNVRSVSCGTDHTAIIMN
jgi:alpha-tubulin suppressor-like RCC1 family protein